MRAAGGTRVWMEGRRGEVSDEVIVERLTPRYRDETGVTVAAPDVARCNRAAHISSITRIPLRNVV